MSRIFPRAAGRALAGNQNVVDGGRFREGELAVKLLHEVLAQRNDENHAEGAADEAGEKDLPPGDVELVDVERRHDKGRARGDDTGSLADTLDHDVFEDGAVGNSQLAKENRQNGDRDRGLDGVAGSQRHVRSGGGEDDDHRHTETDRPHGHLGAEIVRTDDRFVNLSRFQLAVRIRGQKLRGHRLRVFHQASIRYSQRAMNRNTGPYGIRN